MIQHRRKDMKTEQEIRDLLASYISDLRRDYKNMLTRDIFYDIGYIHALYHMIGQTTYYFRLRDSAIKGTKFLYRIKT